MVNLKFVIYYEGSDVPQEEIVVGHFSTTYRSDVLLANGVKTMRYTIDIVNNNSYAEDEVILTNLYQLLFNAQKNRTITQIDVYFKPSNTDEAESTLENNYQILNLVAEGKIAGIHYRRDIRHGSSVGSLQLEYYV